MVGPCLVHAEQYAIVPDTRGGAQTHATGATLRAPGRAFGGDTFEAGLPQPEGRRQLSPSRPSRQGSIALCALYIDHIGLAANRVGVSAGWRVRRVAGRRAPWRSHFDGHARSARACSER